MARNGTKVVWREGNQVRCVRGQIISEDGPFLVFELSGGATLRLAKDAIIKIEEVRGG